jgi:hypothetical protein
VRDRPESVSSSPQNAYLRLHQDDELIAKPGPALTLVRQRIEGRMGIAIDFHRAGKTMTAWSPMIQSAA